GAIALDRRAVQRNPVALVAIKTAAAIFGTTQHDLDRGIGKLAVRHRPAYSATAASGEASRLNAAANKARVYAVFGYLNISAAGPVSTTLPSFITMRLDDIAATTRRSWEMNM